MMLSLKKNTQMFEMEVVRNMWPNMVNQHIGTKENLKTLPFFSSCIIYIRLTTAFRKGNGWSLFPSLRRISEIPHY